MATPATNRPYAPPLVSGGGAALSLATAGLYALPTAGVHFLFYLILVMYLAFAADVLGVAPGALGAIFFASKVWDAVSDPAAGYLSDRTRLRLGRRKSWLLASSVPLALFSLAAWAPPSSLEGGALTAWIAVAIFGFYTAYTIFDVPHLSLGAELSHDPNSRNRIFGARQIVGSIGMLGAWAIGAQLLEDLTNARDSARWLALGAGTFAALSIWISVAALPRERAEYRGRGAESPFKAIRDVWGNPHARILLIAFFIQMLGTGAVGVLFPFVIRHVMKRHDLIAELLVLFPLLTICAIPIWLRLARRFEKRRLWLFAMCMSLAGSSFYLFLDEGTVGYMIAALCLIGPASACGMTLGQALKADIIDYDEYVTGERKEGSYFAAWTFCIKLSQGVMIGIVGITLQWVGFEKGGAEQSEATKTAIVLLLGALPMVGYAVGLAIFSRFRFSEAEHARIRAEIDARASS